MNKKSIIKQLTLLGLEPEYSGQKKVIYHNGKIDNIELLIKIQSNNINLIQR
jgi:hypothetical protein